MWCYISQALFLKICLRCVYTIKGLLLLAGTLANSYPSWHSVAPPGCSTALPSSSPRPSAAVPKPKAERRRPRARAPRAPPSPSTASAAIPDYFGKSTLPLHACRRFQEPGGTDRCAVGDHLLLSLSRRPYVTIKVPCLAGRPLQLVLAMPTR
jgi:hypothetical protein